MPVSKQSVLKQWVNLPKEDTFLGDGIDSKDRLGPIRFKYSFKLECPAPFKIELQAEGADNIEYSAAESRRHRGFRITKVPPQLSTKKETTEVDYEIELPAAGGNRYKLVADYNGKKVESKTVVEVWRRLYYQVISMKGVPYLSSMARFEKAFNDPEKKFNIELIEKNDGRNRMTLLKTIYNDNGNEFRDEARKVYKIQDYEPYAVAVVFSNNIADYKKLNLKDTLTRKIPKKLSRWSPHSEEVLLDVVDEYGNAKYLWEGLVDEHDRKQFWLTSAVFETKDGQFISINRNDITLAGKPDFDLGGYSQVRVNLGNIKRNFLSSIEGRIKLVMNILDGGFTGGFSYTSLNLITVATRAWWYSQPNTDDEMFQTLNHEMGHKIGMVGYGDKDHREVNRRLIEQGVLKEDQEFIFRPELPDAPNTLYGEHRGVNDQGHAGPHCCKGVQYKFQTDGDGDWEGKPECVMFGSNAAQDSSHTWHDTPDTFCDECEKVVRKLDLNGRLLPGLKKRF